MMKSKPLAAAYTLWPVIILSGYFAPEVLAQESGARELILEEITVTAQRREQALIEVPISLEAVTGFELLEQGFRTMDDLAEFSPSVEIDNRVQDQDISIRGIGTTGNNLTLEQGAPIFVDGIHFGRTSMIKGAFMDIRRIEILRGPQPVYFGQNATAGAFSIITRGPSESWQGNVSTEVGNFGRKTVEGGVGGPLSDTVGIRVAGKYDYLEGFLTDVITRDRFPRRRDVAGRVWLQWQPTDKFTSKLKFAKSDTDMGAEAIGVCLGVGYDQPRDPPIGIDALVPGRTTFDQQFDLLDIPKCGGGTSPFENIGIKAPDAYFPIPDDITQEDSRGTGFIDTREIVKRYRRELYNRSLAGYDDFETDTALLDLAYAFDNGIELHALTGWVDYERAYNRNNSNSPFLGNMRQRTEDLSQVSQELRLTSPLGGGIEWMVGAYYQDYDLDLTSDNFRANLRRPRRYNEAWEKSEWKSLFATVTFNFMDDKASLDLGGRYTDVQKEGYIIGYGALWVFADPADPDFRDIDDVIEVVTEDGLAGYAMPWRSRRIPSNWKTPIGMTALDATIRRTPGPYLDTFDAEEFDPQVVFRYRPNEDLALYAKWAQAFKSGGFNTGVGTLSDEENFVLDPELAENWEIGAKGALWDGRARYDAALFWTEIEDLQIATTVVDTQGTGALGSESTNAGLQRVRGLEFSISALLTENLQMRFRGALMDGEMVEYPGAGCTDVEFANAETGPCLTEEESIELVGTDDLEGTIDRSGSEAPRTPDWKFALKFDYSRPMFNGGYMGFANINISLSDEYITNVEDFDLVQKAGRHQDANLSFGIGDPDGRWKASVWARNIFEVQEEYNANLDIEAEGIVTDNLSPSNFMSYGVQFEYYYE